MQLLRRQSDHRTPPDWVHRKSSRCSDLHLAEFSQNECPVGSQVGWVELLLVKNSTGGSGLQHAAPPRRGGPARLLHPAIEGAAFVSLSARTGSDYGLDSTARASRTRCRPRDNAQPVGRAGASPVHDVGTQLLRGGAGNLRRRKLPRRMSSGRDLRRSSGAISPEPDHLRRRADRQRGGSLLRRRHRPRRGPWPATTGCEQLAFNPSLTAVPTTSGADSPSGLDVDLSVPQTQSATVPSPSELKGTTSTSRRASRSTRTPPTARRPAPTPRRRSAPNCGATAPRTRRSGRSRSTARRCPGPSRGDLPGRAAAGRTSTGCSSPRTASRPTSSWPARYIPTRRPVSGDQVPDLPQTPAPGVHACTSSAPSGACWRRPTQCGTYPVDDRIRTLGRDPPEPDVDQLLHDRLRSERAPCPGVRGPSTRAWKPEPATTRPAFTAASR